MVFTYNGSEMKTYLNGEVTGRRTVAGAIDTSSGSMRIGAYSPINGTVSKLFFPGRIDDVRVYDRALSDREVQDLYYYEAPQSASLTVEVKTVQVTLHVKPAKKYQLQTSLDLENWANAGPPFVANSSEVTREFNAVEVGRYFRIQEEP